MSITGGSLPGTRNVWLINDSDIEKVDDMEFIHISKDNQFHKFVSKTANLRDASFLDELKKKRNQAMVFSVEEPTVFGSDKRTCSAWRRRQLNAKLRDNSEDIPDVVEVDLPQVEFEGEVAAATKMKLRTPNTPNMASGVKVELTPSNVHYIRIAMLASIGNKDGSRKRPSEDSSTNCKWTKRGNMHGYLAVHTTPDGTIKTKWISQIKNNHEQMKGIADRFRETGQVENDNNMNEDDDEYNDENADENMDENTDTDKTSACK